MKVHAVNKFFIYVFLFLSLSFFNYDKLDAESQTQYVKGVVSSKLSIDLSNSASDVTDIQNESFGGDYITGSFIQNADYGAYLKIKFINIQTQEDVPTRSLLQYSSIESGNFDLSIQQTKTYLGQWFTNDVLSLSIGYRANDFKKIVEIRNY